MNKEEEKKFDKEFEVVTEIEFGHQHFQKLPTPDKFKSFISQNYISRAELREWVEKINVSGYKDSSGVADFIWSIIKRDFLEFIEKK